MHRPVLYRPCALLVFVLALLCPHPQAGAMEILTLKDCLDHTLGYSRDVLMAVETINQSQGRYVEERAAALPNLKGEVAAVRSYDASLKLYEDFGIDAMGTEYAATLTLTQPLFTWGQIGAAIRAAKYDKVSAEDALRQARQLAMRETANVFYDLVLSIELEKVARDNVDQKERHLKETERKHQMEVATDYDVLAARVALANARPALTQARNTIRLARDRLRYYTGVKGDFEVSGSLASTLQPSAPLREVLDRATANRPEVAYYENRVHVFQELVTVAKGGNKPRLDLKVHAGWISDHDLSGDYPGKRWDAGVFLSVPIFDGFQTRGRVIQAHSRLATTELEMKKLLDEIALDARDAINRVREAIQIAEGLQASVTQAERLLAMAETGYRHGVKTKLEVDDAESNLLAARSNLARSRRDYLVARAKLSWIMGEDLTTVPWQ